MTSNQSIAELAYRLWNDRGRPHGSEEEDWLEAERQLSGAGDEPNERGIDAASKQSFPASDPPGNTLPDRPPSNADAKWDASGKAPRGSGDGVRAVRGVAGNVQASQPPDQSER
jgi:Protein of unknown function (DUF2934)